MRFPVSTGLLIAALSAQALVACDRDPASPDIQRITPPVIAPTTGDDPDEPSYTNATFYVGSAGGDPERKVNCSNIDFPFAIKDASKPLHWQTQFSGNASGVTTNPSGGNLDPGQETVVRVGGSLNAPAGTTFSVTVRSAQAASVTYTIELTCR